MILCSYNFKKEGGRIVYFGGHEKVTAAVILSMQGFSLGLFKWGSRDPILIEIRWPAWEIVSEWRVVCHTAKFGVKEKSRYYIQLWGELGSRSALKGWISSSPWTSSSLLCCIQQFTCNSANLLVYIAWQLGSDQTHIASQSCEFSQNSTTVSRMQEIHFCLDMVF